MYFLGDCILSCYLSEKNRFLFVFFVVFFSSLNVIPVNGYDYQEINTLVKSCYKDIMSCDESLLKINKYQKNSSINKKFACQTRFLGLEANLIMAKNSNFKRKEAKSIIESLIKYC